MKQNQMSRRLAQTARQKLANILLFEISDPSVSLVTITDLEVSIDRSIIKVYFTCDSSKIAQCEAGLLRAKGRIRALLGQALGWRVTPEIFFTFDASTDEAEKISRALENVPETLQVEKDEFGYPIHHVD